jgi:hypothetical protein
MPKKQAARKTPAKKMPAKKATAKKTPAKRKSNDTYVYNTASADNPTMYKSKGKDRVRNEISSLANYGTAGLRNEMRSHGFGNAYTAVTGKKATEKNVNKMNNVQVGLVNRMADKAAGGATNKAYSASLGRSKTVKKNLAAVKSSRARRSPKKK